MAKPAKAERPQNKPGSLAPGGVAPGAASADESVSFWRSITPSVLLDSTPAEWLMNLPAARRHLLMLTLFCACIFVPYLGAVGFWDCWEPEYNEAAREMIQRQDYIHPHYANDFFFSKPILQFWMMDLGQLIAGSSDPARGISVSTEWWVRMVFVIVAVAGLLMFYTGIARTISRRAAVWSVIILATSPLCFMLTRQTVPDMPFVAISSAAVACLMIAVFEREYVQDGWLYGFYTLAGVGCLAKGLLGIVIPAGAMLTYLILSGDWRLLARLRLFTGSLLTFAVMAPWYGTMTAFDGLDYEDQTSWFERFIIHDHFKRIGEGVHTTTPNTIFSYYVEQLGYGMFPWIMLIPTAVMNFMSPRVVRARTRQEKATLFVVAWTLFTFIFFAFAATKFHHYCLPVMPGLAILFALSIEKMMNEGVGKYSLALFAGLPFYGLIAQDLWNEPKHLTDLFVYKYDRPYPAKEVDTHAFWTIWNWSITSKEVFGILFVIGPIVGLLGVTEVRRWLAAPDGVWLQQVRDGLRKRGADVRATIVMLLRGPVLAFHWLMKLLGVQKPVSEEPSDRVFVVGALTFLALAFALYVSIFHWRKLAVHWTQRDLYWEYLEKSRPDEPMGAYMMNWKGETFYSRDTERQIKENGELRDFLAEPGDRKWFLLEEDRLNTLKNLVGSNFNFEVVDKSNVKYALVLVTRQSGQSQL